MITVSHVSGLVQGIRADRLDRIELGRGEVMIEDIVRIAEVLGVEVEEVMG